MTQAVAVQGGIRPWMFFVGLAVLSLVILFSTGRLQGLMPMSDAQASDIAYARTMANATQSERDYWDARLANLEKR